MGDEPRLGLDEYLGRAGAIGVIVSLDDSGGLINRELTSKMDVSNTTLSNRLQEAIDLGLIELTVKGDDHGNSRRYQLTNRGATLKQKLEGSGVGDQYREFLEAKREFREGRKDLKERVRDADINDPRWPFERGHPGSPEER